MEKLVYVIAGSAQPEPEVVIAGSAQPEPEEVIAGSTQPEPDVLTTVFDQVVPALRAAGARPTTVYCTDREMHAKYLRQADLSGAAETAVPAVSGVVELWVDCVDVHEPITASFVAAGLGVAGYLVTESVPVRQPGSWGHREAAPGVSLVTTIDRPAHLDQAAFVRHWTEVHSPLSLKWHPLSGYVRNHVVRAVTPEAPSCAGIVSESFADLDDLLVPERFLGAGDDGVPLADRRATMIADVQAFLDLDRCHPFAMRQYRCGEW